MRNRLIALSACLVAVTALGSSPASAAEPAPAAVPAPVNQSDLLARIERKDPDLVVLDVRTAAEFSAGHVPGARNIPHDVLASRLGELAPLRGKQIVLYCRSGRRTLLAEDILRKAGFPRLGHLEGDYLAWEAEHRPVERSPPAETESR